jgi:hypothetical protein
MIKVSFLYGNVQVPYMAVVGNHENAYNFSHFVNRFTMPNTKHNLFYRFGEKMMRKLAF